MKKKSAQEELTWVHFSDPHFTVPRFAHRRMLMNKRILGYLSWRKRRRNVHRQEVLAAAVADAREQNPDQWLITGDLTHIGLPDEFAQARNWLRELGPAQNVSVIPGNHEAYAPAAWETTQQEWQAWMTSDGSERMGRLDQAYFPYIRRRGPVAFIGVSSALPTAPFLATGAVGGEQLARLREALISTAAEGLLRVVMIHHPPQSGAVNKRKRLVDAEAFREVIADAGAEVVLHGHAHIWCRATLPGLHRSALVMGPPSTSAYHGVMNSEFGGAATAGYFLCRVRVQADEWRISIMRRGYDDVGERFRLIDESVWRIARSSATHSVASAMAHQASA